VDVMTKYLNGIAIESVVPKPTSSSAMLGSVAYYMEAPIAAGGALEVILECKAVSVGDHSGDVLVYVDSKSLHSINHVVRTVVSDKS